jgi:5'-3' exonuclease
MAVNRVILIDAKNQLYRMQFSPSLQRLSTEDGHPTGAIFGCLNYSLLSVAKAFPDSAFVWCWDGSGETWRHKAMLESAQVDDDFFPEAEYTESPERSVSNIDTMSMNFINDMVNQSLGFTKAKSKRPRQPGYKGNRIRPKVQGKGKFPTDEKGRAIVQIAVLKLILTGIGIRNYEIEGLECDDLIGILTRKILKIGGEVVILSGDRDYYQLLKYDKVTIVKNMQGGKPNIVTADSVKQEYGISVKHWVKYRAWTGDHTDNIPHIFKVGKVTARKMLEDGLDPAICEVKLLPTEAIQKYNKYFQPHGIDRMWPSIYGNYKLCKLVTDPMDDVLSPEVKERLDNILKYMKSIKDFCRQDRCKTAESYRKVSVLLSQYELTSLLSRRDELWNIP